MANRITSQQKQEMLELYNKLGTYSAVAKEMGISASTVTKYIKEQKNTKTFNTCIAAKPIENVSLNDIISFCELTPEEIQSYKNWLKEFGR